MTVRQFNMTDEVRKAVDPTQDTGCEIYFSRDEVGIFAEVNGFVVEGKENVAKILREAADTIEKEPA